MEEQHYLTVFDESSLSHFPFPCIISLPVFIAVKAVSEWMLYLGCYYYDHASVMMMKMKLMKDDVVVVWMME